MKFYVNLNDLSTYYFAEVRLENDAVQFYYITNSSPITGVPDMSDRSSYRFTIKYTPTPGPNYLSPAIRTAQELFEAFTGSIPAGTLVTFTDRYNVPLDAGPALALQDKITTYLDQPFCLDPFKGWTQEEMMGPYTSSASLNTLARTSTFKFRSDDSVYDNVRVYALSLIHI